MSEDLRAWIANAMRVFDLSNSTEPVTDEDERRLHFDMADWAATYGPKLLDKVEELADATEAGLRFFRVVAHCDECNQPTNPIFTSREGYCVVHEVKFVDLVKKQYAALRAPGGGEA